MVYVNTSKQLVRIDHITSAAAVATEAATATRATSVGASGPSAVRRMLTAAEQHTSAFEKLYGKSKSIPAQSASIAAGTKKQKQKSTAAAATDSDSMTDINGTGSGGMNASAPVSGVAVSEFSVLFNGPSHALPSLSTLYTAYMHMLTQHTSIAAATLQRQPTTQLPEPSDDAVMTDDTDDTDGTSDRKRTSSAAKTDGPTAATASTVAVEPDSAVLDAQLFAYVSPPPRSFRLADT